MPNVFSHHYQLDESITVVGGIFHFYSIVERNFCKKQQSKATSSPLIHAREKVAKVERTTKTTDHKIRTKHKATHPIGATTNNRIIASEPTATAVNRSFYTVNSFFCEGLFLRYFVNAELRKNKTLAKRRNCLSFTDVGKSCQSREFERGKYVFYAFAKIELYMNI